MSSIVRYSAVPTIRDPGSLNSVCRLSGKGGNKGSGGSGGGGGGGLTNPAFVCVKDGRITLIASNGSAQVLTRPKGKQTDLAPVWSPDPDGDSTNGHQGVIAFLRRPDSGKVWSDLYTIRPDGSQLTLIRSFDSRNVPVPRESDGRITLTWAPDGSWIVYAAYSQLWSVDLDGNLQLVLDGPAMGANAVGDPAFSVDMDLQVVSPFCVDLVPITGVREEP